MAGELELGGPWGEGFGKGITPSSHSFLQKPRLGHESELQLIPLINCYFLPVSASHASICKLRRNHQLHTWKSKHFLQKKKCYVLHTRTTCGGSVKKWQSYCQYLSCLSSTRKKLQTNACWWVSKWRRLCCCHYLSWLLPSSKLSHSWYHYFIIPMLTCFMISSLPTSSHRHKHSLIQAASFQSKTSNKNTSQSLCWCVYQTAINTTIFSCFSLILLIMLLLLYILLYK